MASLANYNFQLYYRAGKTNIDADALLRVSWHRCVPNTLGTHHQVTAVAVEAMQEATLKGPASPTKVYKCNLHIMDLVGDGLQVACRTMDDWHQTQWKDPILGLVIVMIQDGTLGQNPMKLTNSPKLWELLQECNHLKLRQSIVYRTILPKESKEAQFQFVLLAMYQETALTGCHDKVGHLGLERMFELMHNHFFWL